MKTKYLLMKKSILIISSFFLILGLCIPNIVNSQDLKLTKKELKEVRKAEKVNKYKALGTLLESRRFIFEAEYRRGSGTVVSPDGGTDISPDHLNLGRNYIRIDSLIASVQFEGLGPKPKPPQPWDGNIENWELFKNDKELSYDLQFTISGMTKNYYISVDHYGSAILKIGKEVYCGNIKQL
jgi:hypothetical protein